MFLMSVDDLHKQENERMVFRPLLEKERFKLQGHPGELTDLMKVCLARHAAGNAYAVPMAAQVVLPVLRDIAFSGIMDGESTHPLPAAGIIKLINATSSSMTANNVALVSFSQAKVRETSRKLH